MYSDLAKQYMQQQQPAPAEPQQMQIAQPGQEQIQAPAEQAPEQMQAQQQKEDQKSGLGNLLGMFAAFF